MDKKALIDAATLRRSDVTVCGQKIFIVEPSIGLRFDYIRIRNGIKGEKGDYVVRPDTDGAVAMLIQRCTFDDQDGQLFDDTEALGVARGSQRVAGPLLAAILGDEDEDKVKKDLAPTVDSSSPSLPTSGEQSAN